MEQMTETIVVLDVLPEARVAALRALLPPGFTLTAGTEPGEAAMIRLVREADYAITGQVAVSAAVLAAASRLKLLHKWGVGTDNIDLAAARKHGIRIARTTGSNALPVAEFTIGLMLMALRASAYGHHHLQSGDWRGPSALPGQTFLLSGKTVGIIGYGAIGQALARLLSGFGCRILYTRQTVPSGAATGTGPQHVSFGQLVEEADVVSLHCPLTETTMGLINSAVLSRMKRNAVLINVARGGVVVEADLVHALREGIIHGAAMDVFSVEPLPSDSPLIGLPNCVITPHLAAVTTDTFAPTVKRMFANIVAVSEGGSPAEGDQVP
jgi:phosphoglycerate dehydrogenase-like enzyme